MSVRVVFECGGCDAVADGTKRLSKHFVSVSGRSWGFGSAQWDVQVEDVVPEGWVAFDPLTYCCYCPKCWAAIVADHTPDPDTDAIDRHDIAAVVRKTMEETP